jgi:hypothetical protein
MLKSAPEAIALLSERDLRASQCDFSAVTSMKLLGFRRITRDEESLIASRLALLAYLPTDRAIADRSAELRRWRRGNLPNATIGATA